MNKIEVWYNYYLKTTKILYNESEEITFQQIQNKKIEEWINPTTESRIRWEGFWRELSKIILMENLEVNFYGREKDFKLLSETPAEYSKLKIINEHLEQDYIDFKSNNRKVYEYTVDELLEKAKDIQEINIDASIFYLEEAERKGSAAACYALGKYYGNERSKDFNLNKSIDYLIKGAKQNHIEAQRELGFCYFSGIGIKSDKKEALKWFMCAANNGDIGAQYNLGVCLLYGKGVTASPEKAVHWLEKSAKQNDSESQYELGKCYSKGVGTKKNIRNALKWLYLSEENGNKDAGIEIDKILVGDSNGK